MTKLATTDEPQSGLVLGGLSLTPQELNAFDTEKFAQLMELKRSEEGRAAEREFNRALARFQGECPQINKEKDGHNAKYASYEGIRRVVDPILRKHGLAVTFGALTIDDGKARMTGTLRHIDGHSHTEPIELPVDRQMRANDTQKAGSAASYCQRYLLRAMLGLVFKGEDDDGSAAGTQFVNAEQAEEIRRLVDELEQIDKARVQKFWNWCQAAGPEHVPANKYGQAVESLDKAIKEGTR